MSLPAVLFWLAFWHACRLLPRRQRERAVDTALRLRVWSRRDA